MRRLLVLASIALAPTLAFGQWIKYPTDGLPRNKDGTVNRNAPTPRLADGHPDLSGLWHAADPNRCRFCTCDAMIAGGCRSRLSTEAINTPNQPQIRSSILVFGPNRIR